MMMVRRSFILLFALFSFLPWGAEAQRETINWYFGQFQGISFASGAPQNVSGSMMSSMEGCASVSDSLGNLLFYTNGVTVWNRNHNVMSNGTGLAGHVSSTQSCLIVPKPANPLVYYIFTTTSAVTQYGVPGQLCYSTVNMASSSGLGAVTSKNVLLHNTNTTEKLAGVQKGIDCEAWVLTQVTQPDAFHAYEVTAAGVNHVPVISTVGASSPAYTYGQGQLKISPNGTKVANVVRFGQATSLEVFDFDDSTGVVSNPITFPDFQQEYGCEFSPDGTKLYACFYPIYTSTWPTGYGVYQADLNAGSPAAIVSSLTWIATVTGYPGSLQLGPDRRIYVAKNYNTFLGVIQEPNTPGTACNYVDGGFMLNGYGMQGLPNILSSYFIPEPTFSYQDTCYLDSTAFTFFGDIDFYYWDFGDYGSGLHNYVNVKNPKHVYSAPGTYSVRLVSVHNCRYDTVFAELTIVKPDLDLGPDTATCPGGSITLDAGMGHVYQMWEDFSLTQTHLCPDSGWYWCEVMDSLGCVFRDSVLYEYFATPHPYIGPDTSICEDETLDIDAGDFDTWDWSTGQSTRIINVNAAGDYSVMVTDSSGCTGADTMSLYVKPTPFLDLPDLELLCAHQEKLVDVGPGYDSYLWDDGTTTSSRLVTDTGIISLTVWIEGCDASDQMRVAPCTQIYIPTAFTPDGDGLNDVFNAKGVEVQAFTMWIYDRFGQMVFQTTDLNHGWDGRVDGEPAPPGAYVFVIESTDRLGEVFVKRGTVQLLR